MDPVKKINQRITDNGNNSGYNYADNNLGKIPCQETNHADEKNDEKKFVFLVHRGHTSGRFRCSVEVFQEVIIGFQGRSYKYTEILTNPEMET